MKGSFIVFFFFFSFFLFLFLFCLFLREKRKSFSEINERAALRKEEDDEDDRPQVPFLLRSCSFLCSFLLCLFGSGRL